MSTPRVRFALAVALATMAPFTVHAQVASRATTPATVAQEDVLVTLKTLIDAPTPAGMNDQERAAYAAHTSWIKSAYDRVLTAREAGSGLATGRVAPPAIKAPRDAASGLPTGKRQHGVPARDIIRLQTTFEDESRKFQTLSNENYQQHT